jgi:uncharacterized protein YdaU (DUF1376 family)
MPLFLGDLLADTLHLSAQEFGAYTLLFCHAWKHEAKVVVKDAQHIARVGNRHWAEVRGKLSPFFEPPGGLLGGALEVVHRRVAKELAKADELSNKRKGAAMQMHKNRRASASILHAVCITQSQPLKESFLGKVREAEPMQMHPQFEYSQTYTPSGMSPDKGLDYRSPPRTKSDNKLEPLPEHSNADRSKG